MQYVYIMWLRMFKCPVCIKYVCMCVSSDSTADLGRWWFPEQYSLSQPIPYQTRTSNSTMPCSKTVDTQCMYIEHEQYIEEGPRPECA